MNKICKTKNGSKLDGWIESDGLKYIRLDPPVEFQDNPIEKFIEKFAVDFISKLISEAFMISCKITWSIPCSQVCHMSDSLSVHSGILWNSFRLCWTPEVLFNGQNENALPTCLSTSLNSLSTTSSDNNIDVSNKMKLSVSHDKLRGKQILDVYNVPFDSDIYAVPVDVVQNKKLNSCDKENESIHKCGYSMDSGSDEYIVSVASSDDTSSSRNKMKSKAEITTNNVIRQPRRITASSCSTTEPIHVTVDEVHQYLKTLYANSNDVIENKNFQQFSRHFKTPFKSLHNGTLNNEENIINSLKTRHNKYVIEEENKKMKENLETSTKILSKLESKEKLKKWSSCRPNFSYNIKETLCNIFRFKKIPSPDQCLGRKEINYRSDEVGIRLSGYEDRNPPSPITKPPFSKRALPPLPGVEDDDGEKMAPTTDSTPLSPRENKTSNNTSLPFKSKESFASVDFASSIEKVKDVSFKSFSVT